MLEVEDLVTPSRELIHTGDNYHLIYPPRKSLESLFEAKKLAVISAGILIPEEPQSDFWVATLLDEFVDLKLKLGYGKNTARDKSIPVNSELMVIKMAELVNEITFWMFEYNPKQPWTSDPDATGRYINPNSGYLKDYSPKEYYIELICEFIKDRALKKLFVSTEPHKQRLPLPA